MAYNRSKLFNLLFVRELSRRLAGKALNYCAMEIIMLWNSTNVVIHAAHPGTPVSTELTRDSILSSVLIGQFIIRPMAYFYCRTTAEAAQTPLYAALDPKFATQSGLYFENCRVADTSRIACDDSLALRLWDESCRLLNIDKNWI
uniref:Pectinesterase n=1 Tax=Romanomermis culicivorax TaxID=13658 RepID=A0A915K128_ROMCU